MNTVLYRHFDAAGTLLYVGVSLSAIKRLMQHRQVSPWFNDIANITISTFSSRDEALAAERQAVENEHPRYNKMLQLPQPKMPQNKLAAESRRELLEQIVSFRPVYTMQTAADVLGMSTSMLKILIDQGKIGWMRHGVCDRRYISGWQIIEYLENQQAKQGKAA